jgi:hypothetical protein
MHDGVYFLLVVDRSLFFSSSSSQADCCSLFIDLLPNYSKKVITKSHLLCILLYASCLDYILLQQDSERCCSCYVL